MHNYIVQRNTFSPVIANGALNHCSNVEQDLKMLGSKKFNKAHNSGSLFCVNKNKWMKKMLNILNITSVVYM